MMDTPVNTSSGSHHLRNGLILLACTHPISSVILRLAYVDVFVSIVDL